MINFIAVIATPTHAREHSHTPAELETSRWKKMENNKLMEVSCNVPCCYNIIFFSSTFSQSAAPALESRLFWLNCILLLLAFFFCFVVVVSTGPHLSETGNQKCDAPIKEWFLHFKNSSRQISRRKNRKQVLRLFSLFLLSTIGPQCRLSMDFPRTSATKVLIKNQFWHNNRYTASTSW